MSETKRCWKCTEIKSTEEFHKNRAQSDGLEQMCKLCKANDSKTRRQKRQDLGLCHCGRIRKEGYLTCERHVHTSRDWNQINPAKHAAAGKEWRQSVRDKVFGYYGKNCICCGESEPHFLSIDHIEGGGNRHRKEIGGGAPFYSWLIKHNFPEGFQTLCQNCNSGRFRNGGICPHVEKVAYDFEPSLNTLVP